MIAFFIFLIAWVLIRETLTSDMADDLKGIYATGLFVGGMFALPLAIVYNEWRDEDIFKMQSVFSLIGLMFSAIAARFTLPDEVSSLTLAAPLGWWVPQIDNILEMLILASIVGAMAAGMSVYRSRGR